MPSMYELSVELRELEAWLEESGGDVTDEQFAEQVARVRDLLARKVDGYVELLAELKQHAKNCDEESDRLEAMAEKSWAKVARLERLAREAMQAAGHTTLKGERRTLKLVRVGGRPAVQLAADYEGKLPAEFWREVPARRMPDNVAIAEALSGPTPDPRLDGVAKLQERGTRVVAE